MPEAPRPFLDVTRSLSGRRWVDRLDEAGTRMAQAIAQRFDLPELVARVLAGRGVEPDDTLNYLEPTIRQLMPDPSTLTDMDALAERLARAIRDGESVALFGDYDVDGACSVALMTRYLNAFGLAPSVHIPDRIFEGYGPNIAAIDRLIDEGATLIVTLDCGTTSDAPIAHARERGIDLLVIDHHLSDHDLPPATALVNPNRPDDISGQGHLCAAGVTFLVLVAVNRLLRQSGEMRLPDLMGMVDLVGLATICDVVPLKGLNRAYVLRGLDVARRGTNAGLSALTLASRIGGPLNPYHFGFLLGPRINAGGRIGDAGLGAKLLATTEESEALAIAAQLEELNVERQRIEIEAVEEACAAAMAEIGSGEGPPVLVTASANWHPGVVGLVAARLRERFERPAFAVALGPDGGGVGSGRSMPGVDLGRAVIAAVEAGIIPKGGGHPMAAGITLRAGDMARFRAHLSETLGAAVTAARASNVLRIDAALTARGATPDLVRQIERAGPFGAGNSAPVFVLPSHRVYGAQIVGKAGHVSAMLGAGDGARIKAIAFRAAETDLGATLLAAGNNPVHVAGTLGIDHYQGREQVQLRIVDAAPASDL
jgi:single-stranded-DNA-specific exonuclease